METIFADQSISMSEFKKNPARVLRDAVEKPVAVLSQNKPAFYMLTQSLFESLIEELADRDMEPIIRHRLTQQDRAIEVDIDSI